MKLNEYLNKLDNPNLKKKKEKINRFSILSKNKNNQPAGISAKRPEISRKASAQRDVESAIIATL
jgi:hypothetical protein